MAKRNDYDKVIREVQQLSRAPGDFSSMWSDLILSPKDLDAETSAGTLLSKIPDYSDRDIAIIYPALLEQTLEFAIAKALQGEASAVERLFSYQDDGPIHTWHAKSSLGHAVGVFDHRMRRDLRTIGAIRNAFAHSNQKITFAHRSVAHACGYIEAGSRFLGAVTPRLRFAVGVALMASYLHTHHLLAENQREYLYHSLYPPPDAS